MSSREVSRVRVDSDEHHDPRRPGGETHASQFLNSDPGQPHAFLVEDTGVTRPHFHKVDQFQVVVSGEGHIGKHPVAPFAVHYTDWFTPYGPIVPAAGHLSYFTLRAAEDPGMFPMPQSRAEKERATGRTVTVATDLPLEGGVTRPAEPTIETVIEPHHDGLCAYAARLPAGAEVTAPEPAGGFGRYHLVANGSLVQAAGEELPALSLVFTSAGEPAVRLRAGDEGADVLVLQFPVPRPVPPV